MNGAEQALVLAPHTDDGEFGCGGTIARLREEGVHVHYLALSAPAPRDILTAEVHHATAHLGISETDVTVCDFQTRQFSFDRQAILDLLLDFADLQPDIVFCPSSRDVHQDHQVVHAEALRAFKQTTIFGYELPWNNFDFRFQAYVALQPAHLERKLDALGEYRSQSHRSYANPEYIKALALAHGVNVSCGLAEAFEVYRAVI